jgi:hypothetical protein
MADRLSQYPMLSNFNNNMLQQQQLQQQQPSQQHQDSHSILPPNALDQAMIWQQMQVQQQFRPHGAVEMNSHAPAQVRILLLLFSSSFRSQPPSPWERPHFLHSFLSSFFALNSTMVSF